MYHFLTRSRGYMMQVRHSKQTACMQVELASDTLAKLHALRSSCTYCQYEVVAAVHADAE